MSLWDSPGFTAITGFLIAGVFNVLAQIFAHFRQKKQLAHDREQEIRGRRTEALADLQSLLEVQFTALAHLWGFFRNPEVLPALAMSPRDAWTVLKDKGYRIKLWPINGPTTKAVNAYATAIEALSERLVDQQGRALVDGGRENLDGNLSPDLDRRFQEASKTLATTLKETANLMSELNGIGVKTND